MGSGGENPEMILRDFAGMNNAAAREAIGENEFWWLENLLPVAPGALYPVRAQSGPMTTIAETGAPTYVKNFNQAGNDFVFAVWANSGNGYIISVPGYAATKIVNGLLTSGQTSATQYSNLGLLIIDPAGFWDYNITTPNTLTSQSNGLLAPTLQFSKALPGATVLHNPGFFVGTGTGGTVQTQWTVQTVTINAAGTGYVVGDTLYLSDGSPSTPARITVTTIGGGGAITGISLATGGTYPGPPVGGSPTAIGPSGNTVQGGSGTGATFHVQIVTASLTILTRGSGYLGASYADLDAGNVAANIFTISSSGVTQGTQIVVYAGRVWIANGRQISFTDINSYFSFGGAGGFFVITEEYLHKSITALFVANNYLYIFGDDSIDALSNVTVNPTTGVTSFTRLNITEAVGTSQPTSLQGYYRSLGFYHSSGFYLLSGATPEKISEKISGLVAAITSAQPVYAANVLVQIPPNVDGVGASELCAAWMFQFVDNFSQTNPTDTRSGMAMFFRGRWWVMSFDGLVPNGLCSIPISGLQTAFFFSANSLYQALATGTAPWILRTRLWDAGAPLREKQAINTATAFILNGGAQLGVTLYVDTETSQSAYLPEVFSQLQWVNAANQILTWQNAFGQPLIWTVAPKGYYLFTHAVNEGGSQYLGLTISGGANVNRIDMVALRGKQDRNMLT